MLDVRKKTLSHAEISDCSQRVNIKVKTRQDFTALDKIHSETWCEV